MFERSIGTTRRLHDVGIAATPRPSLNERRDRCRSSCRRPHHFVPRHARQDADKSGRVAAASADGAAA